MWCALPRYRGKAPILTSFTLFLLTRYWWVIYKFCMRHYGDKWSVVDINNWFYSDVLSFSRYHESNVKGCALPRSTLTWNRPALASSNFSLDFLEHIGVNLSLTCLLLHVIALVRLNRLTDHRDWHRLGVIFDQIVYWKSGDHACNHRPL